MIGALFGYIMGLLLIANAGEVSTPFLFWTDWALAILYVVAGSKAGWDSARR
jgi:hypothetical protein